MSKAAELAALIGSGQAQGNRNLIINGAMQVAQRGTSATVGPDGTGEGYTVVDRFLNSLSGSVVSTFSQSTDAPSGFANSAKIDITTADTSLGGTEIWHLRYAFEGQDLQSIGKGTSDAKSITLSFYVKSNKTGVYTVGLQDVDNDRRNALAYTINNSNTWERKSLRFNPDTTGAFTNDNNLSLRMNFVLVAGADLKSGTFYNGTWGANVAANRVHSSQVNLGDSTDNEWYITGVQLEVGDGPATPFEHEDFGTTLAKCQRYYYPAEKYNIYGGWAMTWGAATQYPKVNADFPVQMRATPTITYAQSNNGTANQIEWADGSTTGASAWGVGVHGIYYVFTPSNIAANVSGQFRYTADAEL